MGEKIDAYGLISDFRTAALVSAKGSLDWMCWPDFDSEACFASLLGTHGNGRWMLAPKGWRTSSRRYLPGTLVLETTYTQTRGATVTVTDFMPARESNPCVMRIVRGVRGRTKMETSFAPRMDYGSALPILNPLDGGGWSAIDGPHRLVLRSNAPLECRDGAIEAEWTVKEGETYTFSLQHSNSYRDAVPPPRDPESAERAAVTRWTEWNSRNRYTGPYRSAVERSLITLKSLIDKDSGAIVAAPTTSLPEKVGGARNWDYRYCWLRDATFSLLALLHCGYETEAKMWLNWLGRCAQGDPKSLKILYGVTGKREHSEWEAEWLSGYEDSRPVRIGNKASGQLQLDIFGEIFDALYRARCHGVYPLDDSSGNALELPLLERLEEVWSEPDDGIWEFRSRRQHYTQGKVMAWVAFDRGIRMAEEFGMKGPVARWKKMRSKIHDQVCRKGFHRRMNSFTQVYGSKLMDASLLLLPLVGFLPADDPRIVGTVKAVEKYLLRDGLLYRYDTKRVVDTFPAGEGAFLACNFWLVEVYVVQGRLVEARELFEKLLELSNDLELFSEEYDPHHGLVGNYPQAFSHIALVNAALALKLGTSARLLELIHPGRCPGKH